MHAHTRVLDMKQFKIQEQFGSSPNSQLSTHFATYCFGICLQPLCVPYGTLVLLLHMLGQFATQWNKYNQLLHISIHYHYHKQIRWNKPTDISHSTVTYRDRGLGYWPQADRWLYWWDSQDTAPAISGAGTGHMCKGCILHLHCC